MADLLWRRVSEEEKQDIQKQAKDIMESFFKELEGMDSKVVKGAEFIERDKSMRSEGGQSEGDFSRDIMFQNAPNKNKDFIVAEKKKW